MRPVIAMPFTGTSLRRIYMTAKYVRNLIGAGARVRFFRLENPEEMVAGLLQCDGLLLPGGGDVDPARYGQTRSELCQKPDPVRDGGEWKMLEAFLPTGKPILCICRGIQLLNVYCGGTLHQDITHLQRCNHRDFSNRGKGVHDVQLLPGTRLAALFGTGKERVNTIHHQAVDRLGQGLTVCAVSEDGIVEAVELENHPFCLGVQWHPEHLSPKNRQQKKIFDAFIAACRADS